MSKVRRTDAEVQAARESARIGATLGSDLQRTRKRRRMTQEALGERVGLGQVRISEIERGLGATAPLETWIARSMRPVRPWCVPAPQPVAQATNQVSSTRQTVFVKSPLA